MFYYGPAGARIRRRKNQNKGGGVFVLQDQNIGLSRIFSICVSATSHAYGAQKGQKVFNQLRTDPILKYGPENITLTLLYIE